MPFSQIPRVSWADLLPGQIASLATFGDPAHAHLVIGSDGHGSDGIRLYGPDGVTVLIDLNIAAPAVDGSVVTGTVPAAGTAGSAANLTGGTVSGVNTVSGRLVVGDPAHAHVVIGTDGAGADGVRVYAADGVTVLIDLTIAGTPTISSTDIIGALITGGTLETSSNPADARVVIDATGLRAYDDTGSGVPVFEIDTTSGVQVSAIGELDLGAGATLGPVGGVIHTDHGTDNILKLVGPANGSTGQSAAIALHSGTPDGVFPIELEITWDTVIDGDLTTNGQHFYNSIPTRGLSVAGGSAQALPAQPDGYMGVKINGVDRVIPYYH